ncbi:MAG: FHA domain-containing protein [Victivallales bacterium]|nr:FHA domain-containing protein [Victivallales bacterium]
MANVKITILSEKMRGTSFELTNEQYTIGRADSANICIPDPTISGHHCTLLRNEDETYAVRDEGSTNGTRVNGERITDEIVTLKSGDILQVGGVEILIDMGDEHRTEMHTMTVINLDDTGTGTIDSARMKNLGTQGVKTTRKLRENKKHNMMFYGLIGVFGLAVLAALVWLILSLTGDAGVQP